MALPPDNSPVGDGPPVQSRFKKGQSGNPAGRPPKNRDMRKLVEAELDQIVTVSERGKRIRLTKRQIIAKKVVNDAATGDAKALVNLLKLIGGPSEPDNPTVPIDPADLARFALRFLPKSPQPLAEGGFELTLNDASEDNAE